MINYKLCTCCFTGHRKIPPNDVRIVAQRLKDTVIKLIEKGYLYFGAGGTLGFDTLAAQTVLDLKLYYPQIRLILVLPCVTQAKSWSDTDRQIYEYIKERADNVVYISQEYTRGCMHKRNRHLVDNSSACVCYLSKESGGTAYTVEYANKKGLKIINIENRSKTDF